VTTVVTILANRHARRLQQDQFKFDSEQRSAERRQQLRSDVYLPAAEAIVGMAALVGRVVDLKANEEELNRESRAFGVAIARVQAIATPETMRRVSDLQRTAMTEFMAFRCARMPLVARQYSMALRRSGGKCHKVK
jgi:hypothetical protein